MIRKVAVVLFVLLIGGATSGFALDTCSECRAKRMSVSGIEYVYEYCLNTLGGSVPNCQSIPDGNGNATCQSVYSVGSSNCESGVSPLPNYPFQRDPADGTQWVSVTPPPAVQTASIVPADCER